MPLDPQWEATILSRIQGSAFSKWMGVRVTSLGEGSCELRLDLEEHHLNPGGIAHGGVIASLLDACIGLALRTRLGTTAHVTVHLGIHYLSAASGGTLIGRGRAVHSGKKMGYGEAEITTEDGRLVAKGSATFLVLDFRLPGLESRGPAGDA